MKQKKYSLRQIAKALGRSASTICDELKRNKVHKLYNPKKAQHKAYVRRKSARFQGKKIALNDNLRKFVEIGLRDDLSPAALAGRLASHEHDIPSVSKDSIYRFLKSPYGRSIEYQRDCKLRNHKRYRGKSIKLSNRKFIDERPLNIDLRKRVGDIEGDFIVSGKNGKGVLLVVVDRKLRVAFLEQICSVTIEAVHTAFLAIKTRFPEMKTMTTDNDILFRHHKKLEKLLQIQIYFCHPYHSWEKGTVENTNKYIRKDIPKSADISHYSATFLQSIEDKLNRRPLKCLRYFTPTEALARYRSTKKSPNP